MLGDEVGQNIVCSTAVDPEKKSDEHALNLKSSICTVHRIQALHETKVELYNHTVWFQELCRPNRKEKEKNVVVFHCLQRQKQQSSSYTSHPPNSYWPIIG